MKKKSENKSQCLIKARYTIRYHSDTIDTFILLNKCIDSHLTVDFTCLMVNICLSIILTTIRAATFFMFLSLFIEESYLIDSFNTVSVNQSVMLLLIIRTYSSPSSSSSKHCGRYKFTPMSQSFDQYKSLLSLTDDGLGISLNFNI